jgi:hypothetical protein
MTSEEQSATLQQKDAVVSDSRRLVAVARRLCTVAAGTCKETGRVLHLTYVRRIRGGGTDPVSEQALKDSLARGLLPRVRARKTWYGKGEGNMCVACGLVIGTQDIEVEADFDDVPTLRFHSFCFDAWQRACA